EGNISAGAQLNLNTVNSLSNLKGTLQAKQIGITAGSINNSEGKLLATGNSPFSIHADNDLTNNQGFIGGNGDVLLTAANISNIGGTVYARQDLNITTAAKLDN
ncbi:hypothetical protein ACO0LB_20790, partial [Undibacterium sp. SXout7W]|uniref:hypothetical protein n=1 Tax=Undibacterium sp. SXout7W TaxID=3413049 RepID=UPI003BF1AB94